MPAGRINIMWLLTPVQETATINASPCFRYRSTLPSLPIQVLRLRLSGALSIHARPCGFPLLSNREHSTFSRCNTSHRPQKSPNVSAQSPSSWNYWIRFHEHPVLRMSSMSEKNCPNAWVSGSRSMKLKPSSVPEFPQTGT